MCKGIIYPVLESYNTLIIDLGNWKFWDLYSSPAGICQLDEGKKIVHNCQYKIWRRKMDTAENYAKF